MISEFKIRQELRSIELSPEPPLRRVRRIVRLARRARRGAVQLAILGRQFLASGEGARAVRFMTAARRLVALYEELRACARAWLPSSSSTSTFLIPNLAVT